VKNQLKLLIKEVIEKLELEEMPIRQFKNVGDWSKRSSFANQTDRALLTNPKAVQKIHRQWEKTPFDFDMYLVNDPRVNKSEFREVGEVSLDFVRKNMQLSPEEIPDPSSNAITVIFTNNVGDQRYMASGWILAHRLGHAFSRGSGSAKSDWDAFTKRLRELFNEILKDVYGIDTNSVRYDYTDSAKKDKILKYAAQEMGTMKSARDKKLRNWYEFGYELLAQYLLTGKITLNRLPDNIVVGMGGWGRKETRSVKGPESQEMYNRHDLDYYTEELDNMIEHVLNSANGKIYVM